MNQISFATSSKQGGFVLPVGMIMLAVMTIIGIGAMRDSTLQEKMAQNYLDKEASFQAAESGLRAAERVNLRTSYENISRTANFHNTSKVPDGAPDYKTLPWETDPNFGWAVTEVEIGTDKDLLSAQPRAIIEEMQNTASLKVGKEKKNEELAERYYRITTYAVGQTDTARTTVQGVVVQE